MNADTIVRVPGGGDWSNMDLDLTEDSPIEITWKETTHGNNES